jgi:hypothetical protein
VATTFAPSLPQAVLPAERYLVAPRFGWDRAEPLLRAEMCNGAFRPPDAAQATSIEAAYALFVPFWRVEIARPEAALQAAQQRAAYLGVPLAQQHGLGSSPPWMVCARLAFPFTVRAPTALVPGDVRPIALHPSAMVAGDPDPTQGWEVLDADLDEATGRELAEAAYHKNALDPGAFLSGAAPVLHGVHFVRYPVWFARYRYRTESAPTRDGLFYVGLSAVDEAPITALHPSKLMAGAARLRRFFGLRD